MGAGTRRVFFTTADTVSDAEGSRCRAAGVAWPSFWPSCRPSVRPSVLWTVLRTVRPAAFGTAPAGPIRRPARWPYDVGDGGPQAPSTGSRHGRTTC